VAFNIGLGVFGGLTPMVAAGLIAATGLTVIPALYMSFAALVAVLALGLAPDWSRGPLR
jgi:MHS family proline/betaine transporter-like MFS transporter